MSKPSRDDQNYLYQIREQVQEQGLVLFFVGPSGAGKSTCRRRVAELLQAASIECLNFTDYPYAFAEYLRELLFGAGDSGQKFFQGEPGGFEVKTEGDLSTSLDHLANDLETALTKNCVLLVEFARLDLTSAFQHFSQSVSDRSWVFHLDASYDVRKHRLKNRIRLPTVSTEGNSIVIETFDDHPMPSSAIRNLYLSEGFWASGEIFPEHRLIKVENSKLEAHQMNTFITEMLQRIASSNPEASRERTPDEG